jgi:Cupin-like domain
MFENAAPVDVALAPSVGEFAERYVRRERPVIVRGGTKDWPPSYKWTPEYLKATYGTHGVKIGVSTNGGYLDDTERLKLGAEREVAFAKTIDDIFAPTDPEQKCRIDQKPLEAWGALDEEARQSRTFSERSSPRTSGWLRPEALRKRTTTWRIISTSRSAAERRSFSSLRCSSMNSIREAPGTTCRTSAVSRSQRRTFPATHDSVVRLRCVRSLSPATSFTFQFTGGISSIRWRRASTSISGGRLTQAKRCADMACATGRAWRGTAIFTYTSCERSSI